ncbi:MAG TPA: MFS transporter, partial [Stellaceae bacterium]|nr:MFS transporter [Stellaceae bacterium]
GLGLGGVVPSALALAAEFMPKRSRIMLSLVAWYGFAVGSGVAGPIAFYTLRDHRWPVVFVLGGLMATVLIPVLWTLLPESLLVLIRRGEQADMQIRAGLIRLSRRYDRLRVSEFVTSERPERGLPVAMLFRHGRAPATALLWIVFFAGLVTVFFVNAWLPAVLKREDYSETLATVIAAAVQVAGIAGGFAVCYVAQRFDRHLALGAGFLLTALAIAALGLVSNPLMVAGMVLLVGLFALGAQNAATAIAAASYPSAMRATGVGWALGVGRNGQLVSPLLGGYLVLLKWEAHHLLMLVAIPAFVAAAAALALAWTGRRFGDE